MHPQRYDSDMTEPSSRLSPLLVLVLGAAALVVWMVTFPFAVIHWLALRWQSPQGTRVPKATRASDPLPPDPSLSPAA